MAPGHEIVIRAVGTALAGLSMAFAVYMLAYGAGKTRINGMEHLAIFAQPRGTGRRRAEAEPPPADGAPTVDMSATGSLAASAGKAAPIARPVEIVAAEAGPRLAEGRWRDPRRRARRQRPGPGPHRGDRRARRRLGPARRQGRGPSFRGQGRERRRALHPQQDLRVGQSRIPRRRRSAHSTATLAAPAEGGEIADPFLRRGSRQRSKLERRSRSDCRRMCRQRISA